MTPPRDRGEFRGDFYYGNSEFRGIGGRIWSIRESDAAPRDGGDFWGFGGDRFLSSGGMGGSFAPDSRGGTCGPYPNDC